VDRIDQNAVIDLSGPNGPNWTKMDQIITKMDQSGQKCYVDMT